MRRYVKYLIITSTPIILLMSFSLVYFNDSLLVDSIGHLPAHLGAGEMGKKQKVGHVSSELKKKSKTNPVEAQSNKRLKYHLNSELVGGAVKVKESSNRSVIEESIDLVIESDLDKALKLPLLKKGRSSVGNKGMNSGVNDTIGVVQGVQRHVKGDHSNSLSSNHALNSWHSRGIPPHRSQQLTKQKSYNNYLLLIPCSDPLCTSFLSERDLGNFTACKQRTEATFSKKIAKVKKAQVSSVSHLAARFSHGILQPSGECRFMNGSGRSPVGLVSFPGSGNTWVRGLLQKATGICTGGICYALLTYVVCTCSRD